MSQTKAQLIDNLVQPITGALGSASAPTFSFTSDPNTGLYSPGADQLAVTTGGTGRLFIDSSGRLLVGTSTARSNFFGTTLSSLTQTEGTGGSTARGALSVINNDVSNNPPYVLLGRSGSATLGSNAAVVSGSRLGTLTFHGADGISFIEAATVAGEVDGTPGTNDMPGRLVFSTTSDGAASPTERLRITSAGLVGIGTSSPSTILHVNTNVNNSSDYYLDTGATVLIRNDNASGVTSLKLSSSSNSTSALVWGGSGSETLIFANRQTERMRIDSSGRVGIGTTSPGSYGKLAVFGAASNVGQNISGFFYNPDAASSTICIQDNTSASGGGIGSVGNNLVLYSNSGANLAERARIDSNGRLLVGTSTASGYSSSRVIITGAGTDATGAGNLVLQIGQANGSVTADEQIGAITFGDTSGYSYATIVAAADLAAGSDSPGRLVFSTTADGAASSTERMRITSTGKVWLNSTDNPFGQFQIGNVTSNGECAIGFIPGVTQFGPLAASTNGDSVIWIIGPNVYGTGATQFAIGNKGVTNYVAKLASNTATSWTFSSDERLKNIEGPIIAATQIIEAINPVYYSFKTDPAATRKVGLIAQNVLSVLPEVVDVPEEEQNAEGNQQYMGLAMTDLVPVLIAALKESNLKIKQLTDRVAALESA